MASSRNEKSLPSDRVLVGSSTYVDHPLAAVFPMMETKDREELVQDILRHGLREPILLFEGKILDGRNRYRACQEAGVEPSFEMYEGNDPLAYIVSANLRRRHLDTGQRAMVAARLATLRVGDNQHDPEGAGIRAPSQRQAATMLNISRDSVQRARIVLDQGDLDLQRAVNSGRVSITNAAEIALKDKDSQIRVLTLTDDDIVREAARLKRERKIKKAVQPSAKTRADLFAGLSAELPLNREVEFERLIDAAISAIAQLDKIVADAIWDLRFSNSKKVKAGINKYCDEVDRLPTHLKTVLTAVSPPDVVNRGTSSS